MTKKELAAAVSGKLGLTRKEAEQTVDVLLSAVTDALRRGEKVQMFGFGTLEPGVRRFHGSGSDADTLYEVPAVHFRIGTNLKAALSPEKK